ncbi:Coatomer subunit gamma-2 [Zea mays]|uniref:Coatomer subunit gamma-2 n=1 Tax=Zea mays TaxID=4577 RepID=A0A3L6G8V0_MAIZE|nr:Coatomer subunit gamma-2 [Zea mays]
MASSLLQAATKFPQASSTQITGKKQPIRISQPSSAPVELSEAETEYSVNVVKHIFDGHVLQYNCTNTIPEQLLEQVTVFVDASEADEFLEVASKPLESLPYDSPGQTFVAFEKPEGVIATGKFSNILKFIVKEALIY